MDWLTIGKWVAGIVAVAVGAGIVFKLTVSRRSSSDSSVRITSQKNNIAGGDIVGGDKTTK